MDSLEKENLYMSWNNEKEGQVMNMNKLVLNLRKTHRILTIPIVILMVLKGISENTAYGPTVYMILNIGMIYMATTGLFMFFHTMKMKRSKKKKQISSHTA
jgi:hypothetical protein